MDVKPYTGKVHIQYRALLRRSLDWQNRDVAQELGITERDVNIEFSDYASVSVQIVPDDKKHLKLFALPTDSTDILREKFLQYIELPAELLIRWVNALIEANTPADEVLAPDPPIGDTEKN